MFTGIIEELGTVLNLKLLPDSAQLTIKAQKVLEGTQIGDSIAVNGVCLTVIHLTIQQFTVDIMAETLNKTGLPELKSGSLVNLERALQLQARLGGHLVTGHVDGVGTIHRVAPVGIAHLFEINTPASLIPFILPKGSIAIDGVSLTVVESKADWFSVSLIPHSFQQTTLGRKNIGSTVNLETDLIGKYVARLLGQDTSSAKPAMSFSFLAEHGFA